MPLLIKRQSLLITAVKDYQTLKLSNVCSRPFSWKFGHKIGLQEFSGGLGMQKTALRTQTQTISRRSGNQPKKLLRSTIFKKATYTDHL